MVATVLLAVGLYATTNIDNFVVLVALYSDRSYQPAQVTAGAFLGLTVIVGVSVGGAAAASAAPRAYVGLLGFVPLTLGLLKLVAWGRGRPRAEHAVAVAGVGRHGPLVVGAVMVGIGGDNIAAYVPVFAVRSLGDGIVIVVVFVVAAALWCAGAAAIARRAWTGRAMERAGHVVIPFVYVGLGISILVVSGTVGLLAGSG